MHRINEDMSLLNMMMGDMEKQEVWHRPTNYWKKYVSRIDTALRSGGLQSFRSRREIIKGYEYTTLIGMNPMRARRTMHLADGIMRIPGLNVFRGLYHRAFTNLQEQIQHTVASEYQLLYRYCATEPRMRAIFDCVQEQGVGSPVPIMVDGRMYSENMLNHIPAVSLMTTVRPLNRTKRVIEIGGGYGVFAEIILALKGDALEYLVLVDIPPILYIATQYLKTLFPGRVLDYREVRDWSSIDASALNGKILLIPPWMLSRLTCDFDLLWSIGAFQEMEKDRVNMYLDDVQLRCASIFTSGLRAGHALGAGGQKEPIVFSWIADAIQSRGYAQLTLPEHVPERVALRACVANYDFGYFEK